MDRFHDLLVFVRVVEVGNFSAAARSLGLSPSAVSKLLGRLEKRLGARLLQRSSRAVRVTGEGEVYYAKARQALMAADAADDAIALPGVKTTGTLRVHANLTFAKHQLAPVLPEFLARYPRMRVEFVLAPEPLDLIEHGIDLAIRLGAQRNSNLVARRIAVTRRIICASPAYIKAHGRPRTPDELGAHNCLNFTRESLVRTPWLVCRGDAVSEVVVDGNVTANQGEMLLALAETGLGIVRLAEFHVAASIRAGRLVRLLEAFQDQTTDPIYVLFPSKVHLGVRVRSFIEFLETRFGEAPWSA